MSEDVEPAGINEVLLRGRVTSTPLARDLPSGASIVTVRLSVPRERTAMTKGSRQTSDWMVCSAWTALPKKAVRSWKVGDTVEVEGSLRRRVYGAGQAKSSLVEIEVLKGRVVARAR